MVNSLVSKIIPFPAHTKKPRDDEEICCLAVWEVDRLSLCWFSLLGVREGRKPPCAHFTHHDDPWLFEDKRRHFTCMLIMRQHMILTAVRSQIHCLTANSAETHCFMQSCLVIICRCRPTMVSQSRSIAYMKSEQLYICWKITRMTKQYFTSATPHRRKWNRKFHSETLPHKNQIATVRLWDFEGPPSCNMFLCELPPVSLTVRSHCRCFLSNLQSHKVIMT